MSDTALTRRRLIAGGTGLAAGSAVVLAVPATAGAAPVSRLSADDLREILNLKANYAYGSDALAADDETMGRALYEAVFTEDAHVTSDETVINVRGPVALADRVLELVGGALATQHLLGTIRVEPLERDGRPSQQRAAIRAYVQATVIAEDGGLTRVLATYEDLAVETRDGWRLAESHATTLNVEVVPA